MVTWGDRGRESWPEVERGVGRGGERIPSPCGGRSVFFPSGLLLVCDGGEVRFQSRARQVIHFAELFLLRASWAEN